MSQNSDNPIVGILYGAKTKLTDNHQPLYASGNLLRMRTPVYWVRLVMFNGDEADISNVLDKANPLEDEVVLNSFEVN